jgi:hypothetical protein
MASILALVSSVADTINLNSHSASFWEKDIEAITLLCPCIHTLLSMPRLPIGFLMLPEASDLIMGEILRLVCLLLMSNLKGLFGLPSNEQESLWAKLEGLVSQHARVLEDRHFELKIWAFMTAALLQSRGNRGVYLRELHQNETSSNHHPPEEIIRLAREMIWINILESPNVDDLLQEMELDCSETGNK